MPKATTLRPTPTIYDLRRFGILDYSKFRFPIQIFLYEIIVKGLKVFFFNFNYISEFLLKHGYMYVCYDMNELMSFEFNSHVDTERMGRVGVF